MTYRLIVDTYETERIKVLSVWSMFKDEELPARPHPEDARGRSVHEQMVHQCVSEDFWFQRILGVDVGAPPFPRPAPESSSCIDMHRILRDDWMNCAARMRRGGKKKFSFST